MSDNSYTNKCKNLRVLRKSLKLTQQEFLERYFADKRGISRISVSTLSNIEKKGGPRLDEVIAEVCDYLDLEISLFDKPSQEFLEIIRKEILSSTQIAARESNFPSRDSFTGDKASDVNNPGNEGDLVNWGESQGNTTQLVTRLTSYFAEKFFTGELKKGDRIESERDLALHLGVGRAALREALKVLDVLGLLNIIPGQGSYIAESEDNFFIIPLSWSLFLNGSQIDDIIQLRNIMQEQSAYLTALNKDKEGLDKLHEISYMSHKAYKNLDYKGFLEADIAFHSCLAECSGNEIIYSMNRIITNLMARVSQSGMVEDSQLERIYEEHERIYGLILAGDAEGAAAAMRDHYRSSMNRYNYSFIPKRD